MIYIYLEGHDFEYEVRELVKVFFFKKDIVFIYDEEEYTGRGIFIKNVLSSTLDQITSTTTVYIDSKLVSSSTINDIQSIEIEKNTLKKKVKIGIKQSIYDTLSKVSETFAPWGVLTGIRPIKIVHTLLDEGRNEEEIFNILNKEYRLFKDKAELIIDICKRQRKYIYPLDKDKFSLYVSIPFCPTRCLYCSFPTCSVVKYGSYIEEYTDKLIYEIDRISDMMRGKKISTVYIGGGTPTAIPIYNLERIIQSIYKYFEYSDIKEITVEAGRPDTITRQMLQMLKQNNVGRISINPQTMNNSTLKLIGRNHTVEDVIHSYYIAREIGFEVINMDLIVGLPSEETEEIKDTMKKIKKLDPENLTVHTLSVKRGSKFKVTMDKYKIESQKVIDEMLEITKNYARDMKLQPYYLYRQKQILGNLENIGYAKEGKECLYNMIMMEEKETVIAAGMGGVSKIFYPKEDRIERIPNVKSLEEYLNRTEEMVSRKSSRLS
ncbi:oxygen-independent coproporphyrinogen-3 oxidase [Keratinibaculum paraultunense]|uniref:Oxygen-independent coproporphyrinogen-3 oxidase n=1 Tax=Keratinibaculum paraultunense TaxID=1278232 RepID=A0A4R3KXD2_9FIRM|nr:coproporphyrinogen dehydrogenase HemZ [Keratinibaculum paraultunense]QQY78752.1 coproporphyrinogen dehydrogenase HemZ [Keratinibaculum paraultunense]TCS89568.1 oxygen-independent coproporphyrinogen-3 oxidase [Keratinibaculum paraultunense]